MDLTMANYMTKQAAAYQQLVGHVPMMEQTPAYHHIKMATVGLNRPLTSHDAMHRSHLEISSSL